MNVVLINVLALSARVSALNTIIWDPENLRDAGTRLTATIRATLPAEAKMTD
jgi:hypothetical protein